VLSKIPYTYPKRGVFYFNRMVPIDLDVNVGGKVGHSVGVKTSQLRMI